MAKKSNISLVEKQVYMQWLFHCLADSKDNTQCCVDKQIPKACLVYCNASVQPMPYDRLFAPKGVPCSRFGKEVMQCHNPNYIVKSTTF
uniref:Domain of unknown function DB domain-containing protein n=1 Tax=Ditylenchus dipsaci TaxID=166011 RepID=A0A915EC91_9BILA